jgi:hypothetical protein
VVRPDLPARAPWARAWDGVHRPGRPVRGAVGGPAALEAAGAEILTGRGLDFLDPWGNRVQVVEYADVQFSKTPEVMRGMGLELRKSERALAELRDKGLA